MTYVCRSPFSTFSLIFKINVPVGLRTRRNSIARGKNHETYSSGFTPPYVFARLSAYGGEVTMRSTELSLTSFKTSRQSPKTMFDLI